MMKKTLKIGVTLILLITFLLIGNSVNAVNDYINTEAVKMITIQKELGEGMIGATLDVQKLEKTYSVGFEEPLYFTSRDYDLQAIVEELADKKEISSSSKYFNDMEEIADGEMVIYLGLNIAKPEGISRIELADSTGVDLLSHSTFNVVKPQSDGSYNFYLEFAFKHDGGWSQGAGFNYINKELTLKCYENESDTNTKSESNVILTPITGIEPYKSGTLLSYGLTEDNKWVDLGTNIDFDDYIVGINGDNLDSLKKGISYNKNTGTVTINNIGTNHRAEFVRVNVSKIHFTGTNEIGELFCANLNTTVTMDANSTFDGFISKRATSEVVFNLGEDIEQTDYFEYVVGETSITVRPQTYLKSTKLKFTDVKESDWYYGAIKYTTDRGILRGATDTEFRPSKNITRADLVTILWRMEGEPQVTGVKDFPDVSTKAYYANAVRWGTKNNIVSGYNNGNFGPTDNITREQLATILYNYAKYKGKNVTANPDLSKYKDWHKVTGYAQPAMKWAIAKGVVNGKDNSTRLDPQGTASRAEATAMIYNYCTRIK